MTLNASNQSEDTPKTQETKNRPHSLKKQVTSMVNNTMSKLGLGQSSKMKILMEDGSKMKIEPVLSDINFVKILDGDYNETAMYNVTWKIWNQTFQVEYEFRRGFTFGLVDDIKIWGKSVKKDDSFHPRLWDLLRDSIAPHINKEIYEAYSFAETWEKWEEITTPEIDENVITFLKELIERSNDHTPVAVTIRGVGIRIEPGEKVTVENLYKRWETDKIKLQEVYQKRLDVRS